jgi:hypothetical protein
VTLELVGAASGTPNAFYVTDAPHPTAVAVHTPSKGDFVTGGGWLQDETSGERGHFGFVARPTKAGKAAGSLLFTTRTMWDGELAKIVVKSTSLTALRFVGRGTEVLALIDGKASVRISNAASGRVLFDRSGITFTATAGDAGRDAPDRFGISLQFKDQFSWSAPLDDIAKGSIVIHTKGAQPPAN